MNDLKEIVWDDVDCTDLAQDEHKWQTVVTAVMNMDVSQNAENFMTYQGTIYFSRRILFSEVIYFFNQVGR